MTAGGLMSAELAVQAGMLHTVVFLVGFVNPYKFCPLILPVVIVVCGLAGEEISVVTVAYIVRQWQYKIIVGC